MENKRFWAKNIRSEILRGKCTVIIRKYISAGRLFQAEDRIFQAVVTVYYMDDTGETYEDIEYFAFGLKILSQSIINQRNRIIWSCGYFETTRSVTFDFRFPAFYFCGIRISEYRSVTLATDKCPIFVRKNVTLDIWIGLRVSPEFTERTKVNFTDQLKHNCKKRKWVAGQQVYLAVFPILEHVV